MTKKLAAHFAKANQTQSLPAPPGVDRRWDMDWLRVIAFGILIPFHTAVLFLPDSIPHMPNEDASATLGIGVSFFHIFRLGLLFLVAGMGVAFSLKARTKAQFFAERTRRLVIPLIAGIVLLVPPIVYWEKSYIGAVEGSFWAFYPQVFTQGVYPDGFLSWHHFWFIAYLYVFCVVGWPVLRYLRQEGEERRQRFARWAARGGNLFALIGILFGAELLLRPIFPGFHNLVTDWANFSHWFILFLVGFVMAREPILIDRCRDLRWLSLALGAAATILLFRSYYDFAESGFVIKREYTLSNAMVFAGFAGLRMIVAWSVIVACVGFAARHLNRPSAALSYLNRAVYPLFCIHLTLIVGLGYVILPLSWDIPMKFSAIVVGTFVLGLAAYEFVIRRFAVTRLLFGGRSSRPQPSERPRQLGAHQAEAV